LFTRARRPSHGESISSAEVERVVERVQVAEVDAELAHGLDREAHAGALGVGDQRSQSGRARAACSSNESDGAWPAGEERLGADRGRDVEVPARLLERGRAAGRRRRAGTNPTRSRTRPRARRSQHRTCAVDADRVELHHRDADRVHADRRIEGDVRSKGQPSVVT
jgi:hypothetical protein